MSQLEQVATAVGVLQTGSLMHLAQLVLLVAIWRRLHKRRSQTK